MKKLFMIKKVLTLIKIREKNCLKSEKGDQWLEGPEKKIQLYYLE